LFFVPKFLGVFEFLFQGGVLFLGGFLLTPLFKTNFFSNQGPKSYTGLGAWGPGYSCPFLGESNQFWGGGFFFFFTGGGGVGVWLFGPFGGWPPFPFQTWWGCHLAFPPFLFATTQWLFVCFPPTPQKPPCAVCFSPASTSFCGLGGGCVT